MTATKQKLTKAQKRVLVAKDVLKWLKVGKFKPTPGTYLRTDKPYGSKASLLKDELESRSECNVCALGAAFCAMTLRWNGTKSNDAFPYGWVEIDSRIMRGRLESIFSRSQLSEMEEAFETVGMTPQEAEVSGVEPWIFGVRFKDSGDRLVAIMKNVITNKGTFIP